MKFLISSQQAQRMDRLVLARLVGAGGHALRRLAIGKLAPPGAEALGVDPPLGRRQQLLQHHLAVADDGDVDARGAVAISSASMSMRAIVAPAAKRGGAAWLMM